MENIKVLLKTEKKKRNRPKKSRKTKKPERFGRNGGQRPAPWEGPPPWFTLQYERYQYRELLENNKRNTLYKNKLNLNVKVTTTKLGASNKNFPIRSSTKKFYFRIPTILTKSVTFYNETGTQKRP